MIRCEGLDVGRVYLERVPAGKRWLWTIYINGQFPESTACRSQDWRSDLDAAAAQFKQAYEQMRLKAGLPQPQR